MPEPGSVTLHFLRYATAADMSPEDRELIGQAHEAAARAYAPYSNFLVGSALRMSDSDIVTGNNQENAAFPAGICAERTALHAAMSLRPKGVVREIAVVVAGATGDLPVSPCGICRQALVEQEQRQGGPMRVLLALPDGPVFELANARQLLPLSFDASFLGT